MSASRTLEHAGDDQHFRHALAELGVNAAVLRVLAMGLVWLGRQDADDAQLR